MTAGWVVIIAAATTLLRLSVGDFSNNNLADWHEKSFAGKTSYQLTSVDNSLRLCADSQKSASGLFKTIDVNLSKTPWLNWSWKIDNVIDGVNERQKNGDDYPARVYVIFKTGPFPWQLQTINYVFSNSQSLESRWPNAFTSRAQMIAVRSGKSDTGQWWQEKRNVAADYRQLFGRKLRHVSSVAIMSDTDNSRSSAKACYGDIYFTNE